VPHARSGVFDRAPARGRCEVLHRLAPCRSSAKLPVKCEETVPGSEQFGPPQAAGRSRASHERSSENESKREQRLAQRVKHRRVPLMVNWRFLIGGEQPF
jgi:hypothetical protein